MSSLRPPAIYFERYTATDGSTAGGSTAWPQLSPGPGAAMLTNIDARPSTGGTLHLSGLYFETAGTVGIVPSAVPSGTTAATVTIAVAAKTTLDVTPHALDPATTTALPLVLLYAPLGPGGR